MKTQLTNRATPVARLVTLAWAIGLLSSCEKDHPLEPSLAAALTASSNLTTTAASTSQVDLAWQDNSPNETGFEIHRSPTGPTGTFALLAKTGANVTSYSDGGLTPTTQYCYKIRAFQTTGRKTNYSGYSGTACATTLGLPPSPVNAPSGLDARPTGTWGVLITWVDNATNEEGFHVERAATSTGPWEHVIGLLYPDATRHWDGSATSEREVCYRVVAFNAQGSSPPSNVDCTAPPAAPTMLDGTAEDAQTVVLSWADNSAVEDGYEVLRSTDGNYSAVATLPANSTGFRDGGLTGNLTYGYMVRAIKDGGWSNPSHEIAVPVGLLTPPTAPVLYQPEGYFLGHILLSWGDGPNNHEGYKIERCDATTCTDADYMVVATTGPSARSWWDTSGPGVVVSYRIRATNRLGDSSPSNVMYGRACDEVVDWEAPCWP